MWNLLRGNADLFRGPWNHPGLKAELNIEMRGARVYSTGRAKAELIDSASGHRQ